MAIYKKIKLNAFNADLAQLVEQLNRNQKVEGSSPLIGTRLIDTQIVLGLNNI